MNVTKTVIAREISVKVKSKVWVITVAIISLFFIISGIVGAAILNQPPVQKSFVITEEAYPVAQIYEVTNSNTTFIVTKLGEDNLELVKNGTAKALIDFKNNELKVTTKSSFDELDIADLQMWTAATSQAVLAAQIEKLGGDATKIQTEVAEVKVTQSAIEESAVNKDYIGYSTGLAVALMLFMLIFTAGSSIAMGIAEEKESKVVEVMLATVKPSQLMSGKIIGIGIVNLLTFAIPMACALLTATFTGLLKFVPQIDFNTLLFVCLLWLIVGYITYSVVFAAFGSTASGVIDAKTVITPITLFSVLALYAAMYVPVFLPANSIFIHIISLVPILAPYGAPTVFAMGLIPLSEVLVSLAISIVCIPILIIICGRVYKRSILLSGKTVKRLNFGKSKK
jgi:ABC-2 type transport system permease protein